MTRSADSPPARPRDLPVVGMHCAGCVANVEKLVGSVAGVTEATANFGTHRLQVTGDVPYARLGAALDRGGYGLGLRTTRLYGVGGDAVAQVEALDGVVSVRRTGDGLDVEHVDAADVLDALRALVGEAGRLETEADPQARRLAEDEARWRTRVLLGLPLTVFLFLAPHLPLDGLLAAILVTGAATVMQFGIGAVFLRAAAAAVRSKRADMNVLVALGTLTAYLYSTWLTWRHLGHDAQHAHYEMCALIILLVAVGRWLEARARRTTGDAVAALARLAPERALLVGPDGETTREVAVARLFVGDRVRVLPGAAVPVDGVVVRGRTELDESMLTGESMPVARGVGEAVTGGTLNGSGSVDVEVAAVGAETTLARIMAWVAHAQGARAPVARMADRVAAVFVPAVLVVAALTFVGWFAVSGGADVERAMLATIAVLLIACPCALGLATPTAIVVGTGRAAKRGILVKGGEVLEAAARVTRVVFDKTGTLTKGQPELVDLQVVDGDPMRLLARVGAVERLSEHPLARAIVRGAEARGMEAPPAREFHAEPGRGARAWVGALEVHVGNRAWFEEEGIDPTPLDGLVAAADAQGATAVLCALGRKALGVLSVRDEPRPEAADAIGALRDAGLGVSILSGDREATVRVLADELGADEARGEVGPLEKAEVVTTMEDVAMVGDGINDAPALAAADVGIAMGGATDVATATAGIALVRSDLRRVPEALGIARATLRTIRQNLFWAFAYNVIGIPLAAFGVLHPLFAAAAMALSSVSVLANSLRLRSTKLPISGHTA